MDPMEMLDELFEEEFQKFMQGRYSRTKDEDWERAQAQKPIETMKGPCPHGAASKLQCHRCYFEGNGYNEK